MTVNFQVPIISLEGDGVLTTYTFAYELIETSDLYVFVDGVLQIEYSTYTVDNVTEDGGEVEFIEAPADGVQVLIFRKTNITQQIDYTDNSPFMAESHEGALDKLIIILQELLKGAYAGYDSDGNLQTLTFDLSVTPEETTVTINNSGGTDAVLQPWVSAELAGVFHGEIGNVPADESATTKPDGYIWIQTDPVV